MKLLTVLIFILVLWIQTLDAYHKNDLFKIESQHHVQTNNTTASLLDAVTHIKNIQNIILAYLCIWEELDHKSARQAIDKFFPTMSAYEKYFPIALSSEGNFLAWTSNTENILKITYLHTHACTFLKKVKRDQIIGIAFLPGGQYCITVQKNLKQKIWKNDSGNCIKILAKDLLDPQAFSHDSRYYADYSSETAVINIIDIETCQIILKLIGHTHELTTVAFCPYNRYLASGSRDKSIKIWDLNARSCMKSRKHTAPIVSVAFSPCGSFIVSSSEDNLVNIWSVPTGKNILCVQFSNWRVNPGALWCINSGIFIQDGKRRIISAQRSKTLELEDACTHKIIERFANAHSWLIKSVSFSADSMYIVADCVYKYKTEYCQFEIPTNTSSQSAYVQTRGAFQQEIVIVDRTTPIFKQILLKNQAYEIECADPDKIAAAPTTKLCVIL